VLVGVVLSRFFAVMLGVQGVAVCDVGVMRSLFMVACFMLLSRFCVMFRRGFVMAGSLAMMFSAFVWHRFVSFAE
jgi:hypothetical protein